MSEEKDPLVEELNKVLAKGGLFKVLSIGDINHNPHEFMIGPKHVTHAADHCGGVLGDATFDVVPCARAGCNLLYKDHKSDKIAFLQLSRDGKNQEANDELVLIKQILTDNKIDGIIMVESEQEYKIT